MMAIIYTNPNASKHALGVHIALHGIVLVIPQLILNQINYFEKIAHNIACHVLLLHPVKHANPALH